MSNSNRLTASTAQPENCVGIFFSAGEIHHQLQFDVTRRQTYKNHIKSFTCILYISSDDVNLSTRDFAFMFILRWLSLY